MKLAVFRSPLLWRTYLVMFSLVGVAVLVGGWEGAVLAGVLGAVLLYLIIRNVLSPLATMATAARAMAKGSYNQRIIATQFDEAAVAQLGEALNYISGELGVRLQALTEDRNRLETVLAASLEGIVAIDSSGAIILMNQAAQKLLGVSSDQCLSQRFDLCFRNETLLDLTEEALFSHELRKTEIQEMGKTLEVYTTPLKENMGVVLVVHDVSEMRRLETLRRDFVANVSHELKTPLTSIRAYVDTLLDGGLEDQENNLRFLRKIEVHAVRLGALITDLLSLSKIESGDAYKQHVPVNLDELLLGSYQRLAPMAESKNIRYELHTGADTTYILGDTEAANQIFDNLIDNAIKYTEPGGSIDVSIHKTRERVAVEVADSGIGIPKQDLPRIFERFYRVDKARSRELGGTGLGLSIAKHLVQALGGTIDVKSRAGSGSTFTATFPTI